MKDKTNKEIKSNLQPKPCKEYLKYTFSHDEIHEKGSELARLSQELIALEDEKKALMADLKAKMDSKRATVNLLGVQINNGYEYRYLDCVLTYDDPAPGKKSIHRVDTGAHIRTDLMTPEDNQLVLALSKPMKDDGEVS